MHARALRLLTALTALAMLRCRERTPPPSPSTSSAASSSSSSSSASSSTASSSAPSSALAPLTSDPPVLALPVDGYSDAAISVPLGATRPRPVIVATHGMWDLPEGFCENWRWIVGDRAWVLCPRGVPQPDRTFLFRGADALAKEIDAGLHALAERYPGYVDDGPMLYAGFSLGAQLGVAIVTREPSRYPRAVFSEGGDDDFNEGLARAYGKGGGKRVLFACGMRGRVGNSTYVAGALTRAGVPARVVLGKLPDAGQYTHWYGGPVAEETKAQLDWLLEGDPRWDSD